AATARFGTPWFALAGPDAHIRCSTTTREACMRRIVLASALGLGLSAAVGSAQVARRPFLFKDGRGEVAAARARGERDVTAIMAAMPGATAQLAAAIGAIGGTIRFRDDNVDYIRARVPVDSVEKLASDPSMHSLDITISGTGRTFSADVPAESGLRSTGY